MNIKQAIEKSLFFVGAGISKEADCKTSSDMLDALKTLICSESRFFGKTECETIKFLFSCLEYQSEWRKLEMDNQFSVAPNIEELALLIRRIKNRDHFLPYPVTGNWADKLINLETKFKENEGQQSGMGLFGKIEYEIKDNLLQSWLEVKNTDFLKPLDKFFESNDDDFSIEVFSLNNDLVFEKHYSDHVPFRGFCSGEWRGFHEKSLEEEYNRINLYKLHGSLDWARLIDGSVIENHRLTEEDEDIKIDHNPFIIFGHGIKFFSVEPFFSLIQNFREKLKERNYYFIIGYSFFDPYINNLLFQAIKEARDENKKIIIVNNKFAFPPLNENHFIVDPFFGNRMKHEDPNAKKILTDYLEHIQKNTFYSELPEFNVKQIPADALYYLKMGASEFLEKYFENSGSLLIDFLEKFESDKKENLPFQ